MNESNVPAGRIWWRAILGAAWLSVATWTWVTSADVLLASHPAHAVTAALAGLVGVIVLALAVVALARRRAGLSVPTRARWLVLAWRGLALLVSAAVLGSLVYLRPFSATDDAIALVDHSGAVRVDDSTTRLTLTPVGTAPDTALIFQPGARVDPRAYLRLLEPVAAAGYLVVIVKQPFGIGFTALGAPTGIIADHDEIDHWVLGGHSLGGVAASWYVERHPAQIAGLLLWASYPLDSLAAMTELHVTSVSGTQDALATPADIEASRADLPPDATFVAIEGAVHSFFGDYGVQPGDGEPSVSRGAAQEEIVEVSTALLATLTSD
ncbi:alpha/beta hydrolase [Nocardioides sp.]|uniref:alpha/beta hydrolase n=1 Tax=Nocardioides sp. TaxID=35761 RepID=UPI003D107C42